MFEEWTPGDQSSPLIFCPHPLKRNTFNISIFVSPGPTSDGHLAQVPEGCACWFEFALVLKQTGLSPPDCFPPIAVTHRPGDRRLPNCAASFSLRFRANVCVFFNNHRIHVGLGHQFRRVIGGSGSGVGLPGSKAQTVCLLSYLSLLVWEMGILDSAYLPRWGFVGVKRSRSAILLWSSVWCRVSVH